MKKNIIALAAFVSLFAATRVFASVSSYDTSSFAQYCSAHATTCRKVDSSNDGFSATATCPNQGQLIDAVYAHGGDGSTVYLMSDSHFSLIGGGVGFNFATISKTQSGHDVSWIGITCYTPTPTPTPTPRPSCTPTPSPTPTCTPSPTPSPSPTVTPSPSPSPSPTPTPSATPKPTPRPCDNDGIPCATPTPTPTPAPTATPVPGLGQQSKTAISDPICVGQNFDAKIQLLLDGNPVKDVNVKFVYSNEAKYAKTGTDGWAGVAYGYKDETNVEFIPEQGYPTQLQRLVKSQNCTTPAVLGASTTSGKVLGATTLAKTGAFEDALMNMVGWMGASLTAVGSFLYAKKKN